MNGVWVHEWVAPMVCRQVIFLFVTLLSVLLGQAFFLSLGLLWCLGLSVFVFLIVMDVMGWMASFPLDVLLTPYVDANVQAHKVSILMKSLNLSSFAGRCGQLSMSAGALRELSTWPS